MAVPPHIVKVIKATTPVVAPLVPALVNSFYDIFFEHHPWTKSFFPYAHIHNRVQLESLGASITGAVLHVENLGSMAPRLTEIFHHHAGLEILPEHYAALHGCFMGAIAANVPTKHLTPEVVQAWSDFLQIVIDFFVAEEEKLYKQNDARGWRGFKDLKVIGKEKVGKDVITFTFETHKPVDFKAGQYITVRCPTPGNSWSPEARRHYTVTGIPGKNELQITTKHVPHGSVSGYMHSRLEVGDTLPVSIPMGLATVNTTKGHVLVSAGIGITSSLAAFQALPKDKCLAFVHVDKNAAAHPLKERALTAGDKNLNIYTETSGKWKANALIDRILAKTGDEAFNGAVFRLCGPPQWMLAVHDELSTRGVTNIQADFFAPKTANV